MDYTDEQHLVDAATRMIQKLEEELGAKVEDLDVSLRLADGTARVRVNEERVRVDIG